jgi:hypothetical protein
MSYRTTVRLPEPPPDPFGERRRPVLHESVQVLGGRFQFESNSPQLLRVVRLAYANLPAHRFSRHSPRFLVRVLLTPSERVSAALRAGGEPPKVRPLAGGGILCGAMEDSSFAAVDPQRRSALLVIAESMLRFPYHLRYELLEFAVYTLAARAQGLVPLHAACVSRGGQGILLMGPSGSGKSTVTLHCLLDGFDFVAEDSVLVKPAGLLATGVANFLHVRHDSLQFLNGAAQARQIGKSPVIRRRSGVEKLEIDLRRPAYQLANAPVPAAAVVFLSPRRARTQRELFVPVSKQVLVRRLGEQQQYAATQPGWSSFSRQVSSLPAFELRRGRHPLEAVEALEGILQ